jgi:acyl-CoA thioesterase FadM
MWKICTKCGKHKALWEFNRRKGSEFYLSSACKICTRKESRKYYVANKEELKAWHRNYYKENREAALAYEKRRRERFPEIYKDRRKKQYEKHRDKRLIEKKIYYQENDSNIKEKTILYLLENAKYDFYNDKLTVEESPRLSVDGVSLEVKCRYCRKYFIPTNLMVKHRVQALNGTIADLGERNLYCSEKCKLACPVFKAYALVPNKPTLREPIPQELRDEVYERAEGMCEVCGKNPVVQFHHEKPVATHPHLQLDKDNLWGLCKYCHYEVCHQLEGCTLAELRKNSVNTVCNRTN